MKTIVICKEAGEFAENKDVARDLREQVVLPALSAGEDVTIDFSGVSGATQSFLHALISQAVRLYGDDVYDRIVFKNCTPTIQQIINIVADYMGDGS